MSRISKVEDVDKNMKATIEDPNSLVYFNPLNDKRFKIEGLAFVEQEKKYFRLPIDCKDKVTEAVYWLAGHPSGGQIRFKTNANKISVKIKNQGDYLMCHMACTGQQGVDLYYKRKADKEYKFFTCAKFAAPATEYESVMFSSDEHEEKEIIINLPLYEGLAEILIGVDKQSYIKTSKKHRQKGKVVIYGTSITQGGCASRPGMSFTNILSRKLDCEFINLGFSGSGLGEPEVAHIIASIPEVSMLILDYEANGGATGDMKHNLEYFIDIFREKYPLTPIVVVSKVLNTTIVFNQKELEKKKFYLNFQSNCVQKRREKGDENIYFIDGSTLLDKDGFECFVDGCHPTDLGFFQMAKSLKPIIGKILKKSL